MEYHRPLLLRIAGSLAALTLVACVPLLAGCRGRDDEVIIATVPNSLSPLGQRVIKALSPTVTFVELNVEIPKPDRVSPEERVFLTVSRLTSSGIERIAELLQPEPSEPLLAGVDLDATERSVRIFWVSESTYLASENALQLPDEVAASSRRGYLAEPLGEITPVVALAVSSDLVLPSLPSFSSHEELEEFAGTLTDEQTVYVAFITGLSARH